MVPEVWSSTDSIILSSWATFCFFTPLPLHLPPNKPKNDIKNEKNLNKMEISSFYTSVPKTLIIRYVPEMWRETDVIAIFILGHTFTFYSPNSPKKRKFQNNEKKPRGIIILHKCTKNHDQMLHCSCILVRVGWNYFLFKAISMPFHPP